MVIHDSSSSGFTQKQKVHISDENWLIRNIANREPIPRDPFLERGKAGFPILASRVYRKQIIKPIDVPHERGLGREEEREREYSGNLF